MTRTAILCGFLSGLIAATRYPIGILILVPMIVVRAELKITLAIFCSALVAFFLATPYAVLDWRAMTDALRHLGRFASSPAFPGLWNSRWTNPVYIVCVMMPYGAGLATAMFFWAGVRIIWREDK